MVNPGHEQAARDVSGIINQQISEKVSFLRQVEEAVKDHHDEKIYQLLDAQRYAKEIEHREQQPNNQSVMSLVDDITNYLSNFLSVNLINYLGKKYPFFYYEEYETGHYRIYFGNWWDRREFGELDVLNVRFLFNDDEYDKLKKTFELAHNNKRYNSDKIDKISAENDRLQDLIDHQREREEKRAKLQEQLKDISSHSGIWESSKNKESRQNLLNALQKLEDEEEESRTAAQTIKDNEQVVLSLSKENTILSYEQKSILDTFSSFEDFELANRNLYANYIKSLSDDGEKQVTDDEQ
ncbi:exonuclease SbcC [Limosilactobacillus fastidiosus]|uniref:Exonuclease SbcC n=1 Tax=Limosilactobacillus fastidiosus TaxID=2759855 RepID=A0A7W3YCI1_9LACO|nr:exonuclease SbcC [Limosilactobacillus fastidiosus]MBB1063727.1 exonuclease SbcC [Limosilactobacillus fastidiosus]MBB1086744.1 exonuclease SbcC [Limosilactobacillus fastidiosus]MCD7084302.1 exonuclease SbcC [Limosilactobacillus fastidiosus]MCD7085529.1 exonuclease SbcC [Limosilactobacillus fastidiosus]MCD7114760.1 exonuclease SbcC [Limosilactobacillus fastidiosus]